jgi:hypothetical protein
MNENLHEELYRNASCKISQGSNKVSSCVDVKDGATGVFPYSKAQLPYTLV